MANAPFTFSDINYFLVIIPGFIFVWTYRKLTHAEKIGEFEYAAWSFIWGILLVGTTTWLVKLIFDYNKIMQNPYSISIAYGFLGLVIGFLVSLPISWFKNKIK